MTEDEVQALQKQLKEARDQTSSDRKLIRRAAEVLAEIDRGVGLSDEQADVLASLRIRIEGKARASLDDLLSAAGDIKGAKSKDLGDLLAPKEGGAREWPEVKEEKKEWPGL